MVINLFTSIAHIIISIVDAITFFLPDVTELPFGMQEVLEFVVGAIKGFVTVFPFAELPWNLFLLGLFIEFLYYSWYWVNWFIDKIRG